MGFGSLWPLALLVLVPVIILLYILKQEAKQHSFSSTMLWQEVYRNIEATRPWEKLKKNLLMILQILTVLLFIFALMGPWLKSLGSEKTQVILVLDSSASMDTLYDGNQTRLEAAKEAACRYVDSLPVGTVLHVIDSNQQAVLLLSSSKDRTESNPGNQADKSGRRFIGFSGTGSVLCEPVRGYTDCIFYRYCI